MSKVEATERTDYPQRLDRFKNEGRPCPFCGSTRGEVHFDNLTGYIPLWWYRCRYCGSQGPVAGDSAEQALRYWNGRQEGSLYADQEAQRRKQE